MSQINVNTITGKDGGSAVNFPHGITVTGVVTATTLNQNVTGNVTAGSFTGPLTGTASTASTLAAGATGADLTLSGNLTVNGTTTTIDTAVTAVDSLAVDGNITAGGQVKVGINTLVTPNGNADNFVIDTGDVDSGLSILSATTGRIYFGDAADAEAGSIRYVHSDNSMRFETNSTERLRIDGNGTTKFKGPLTEKFHNDSNALTGDYNHDLITHGNVYWSVSNSSGPFTFNLRGSASVSLDSMMSDGESLSFLLTHSTNNASNYMTAFKVDGNTLINGTHIWWSGGTAPSAAGTSGYDVYSFTLYKIGGASFRAFASLTNHA